MIDIAGNWQRIRSRVAHAAQRAGREPQSVRIIAVSKTQPVELIQQAIAAGATEIGENYVQEAAEKIARCPLPAHWHLIGHLQRNKAARAVELFEMIQTVDSVALADALTRQAERRGRSVRVLIEVNIGGETTKHGADPAQLQSLLVSLRDRDALLIDGLMTIPPPGPTPESVRHHFRALRELRDRVQAVAPPNAPLQELSMGMTDDFEVAIEEGATMVRIGRGIFGERET